jgi:methyl-accepting chemotaxis protein
MPVMTGLIVLREFSFIIAMCIILILLSRNLTDVIKYDDQSTSQLYQIIDQSEARNRITEIIKEKTDDLFQKIDSQHTMLNNFNSNMESQAARFNEMSATMEEISGASDQIATESVTQVEGNVKMESIIDNFKEIRIETKKNLDETYNDIQSVSDQSATANAHLREVEKTVYAIKDQSNRIGQTVELIVDIADRINLLSLNASIEAARAGESGRGFAVVADEIGKLAFQTQESIKEINSVISSSSKSTVEGATVIQKTAQMMREMISLMDQGAEKIRTLQESLLIEDKFTQIIIGQMKDNITQAKKISTATDEQKIAVETSFKAIEEGINILDGMVTEVKSMAKTSDEIYDNATDIRTETKQIEAESNDE